MDWFGNLRVLLFADDVVVFASLSHDLQQDLQSSVKQMAWKSAPLKLGKHYIFSLYSWVS